MSLRSTLVAASHLAHPQVLKVDQAADPLHRAEAVRADVQRLELGELFKALDGGELVVGNVQRRQEFAVGNGGHVSDGVERNVQVGELWRNEGVANLC